MTKLTPIDELADKLEIHYECHYDSINDRDYTEYTLTEYQLEALRQAIISDFVSKLNVAMTTSDYTDDYGVFHPSAKLYALPEWIGK